MAIKHTKTAIPDVDKVTCVDWNANHTGTLNHGTELTNVTADQHHAQLHNAASHTDIASTGAQIDDAVSKKHDRQHSIISTSDHTSAATPAQILKADANGLPIDATNTDAEVSDAVTKAHTQNTDTALGSGCVALDHGAAATDMVVNVCYGTGDPPAANTTTEGALFVKYTA